MVTRFNSPRADDLNVEFDYHGDEFFKCLQRSRVFYSCGNPHVVEFNVVFMSRLQKTFCLEILAVSVNIITNLESVNCC